MVDYAYPDENNMAGMEHHERFAECMNRLVDHLVTERGISDGEAVTLSGFTGMAHIDAAKSGQDIRDAKAIGDSIGALYESAKTAAPDASVMDEAIHFFQQDLNRYNVDLHQVADYVLHAEHDAEGSVIQPESGLSVTDPASGVVEPEPTGVSGPIPPTLEGEIVDEEETGSTDMDAEFNEWHSPGRYHPELSDQMVTLLRATAMSIRMTKPAQGQGGSGLGLVDGMLKPFRLHVAHNRAKHLERAAEGLREFDRLVSRGPIKGESFAEHEAVLKKAAGDFLGHMNKGMSQPGLETALKNGMDQKLVTKLQDGFDAWKNMNGNLLEKMKLDKLAAGIGQMFSRIFSKTAGSAPA
jgi:hypothetical protein